MIIRNEELELEIHFKGEDEKEFVVYNLASVWNENRDMVENKDIWMQGYIRDWDLEEVNYHFSGNYDCSDGFLTSLIEKLKFINGILKKMPIQNNSDKTLKLETCK